MQLLGVHPQNRGSVYPQQDVCLGLNNKLVHRGYIKDIMDHMGITVQEFPEAERPKDYETIMDYNMRKSRNNGILASCFDETDNILYGLLAHCHLLLILRAWRNGAKWGLTTSGGAQLLDQDGKLSVSLAATHENTKDLAEVISLGMLVEVLSWKLLREEPDAGVTISAAFNQDHEAALHITELSKLAALIQSINNMKEVQLAGEISFLTVKEKARASLDTVVDEPDFIELLQFVISLDPLNSPFCQDLLDFGAYFVNQKKRQLHFHAFTTVNKLPDNCPHTKVAVLKRAYRKKPSHTFCPAPEATWALAPMSSLYLLEGTLKYFHVQCKKAAVAEGLEGNEHAQSLLLANVDVAATDAFIAAKNIKVKEALKAATQKYFDQILANGRKADKDFALPAPPQDMAWLAEPKTESEKDKEVSKTPAEEKQIMPRILRFNESGELQNAQVREESFIKQDKRFDIPWQTWCDRVSKANIPLDIFKGQLLLVLTMLFRSEHHRAQPLRMDKKTSSSSSDLKVFATADLKASQLTLIPCVSKLDKIIRTSDHPHRVPLWAAQCAGDPETTHIENHEKFYVLPELALPQWDDGPEIDPPQWRLTNDVKLHPFWAIRRLDPRELKSEELAVNCHFEEKKFSNVTIGSINMDSVGCTMSLIVLVLTNTEPIKAGTELILGKTVKKADKKKAAHLER